MKRNLCYLNLTDLPQTLPSGSQKPLHANRERAVCAGLGCPTAPSQPGTVHSGWHLLSWASVLPSPLSAPPRAA